MEEIFNLFCKVGIYLIPAATGKDAGVAVKSRFKDKTIRYFSLTAAVLAFIVHLMDGM